MPGVQLLFIAGSGCPPQLRHPLPVTHVQKPQAGRRMPMRSLAMSVAVLAALATPVLAQTTMTPQGVPPGTNPETGARAGNQVGTGMSLPMGYRSSNIDERDTRSLIAQNLPSPPVGENANAVDYLRAAQSALVAGHTGEAQQSLEMAQTRLL